MNVEIKLNPYNKSYLKENIEVSITHNGYQWSSLNMDGIEPERGIWI